MTCTRAEVLRTGSAAAAAAALLPPDPAAAAAKTDSSYAFLSARFSDPSPKQLSASVTDAIAAGFNRIDNLVFPSWMEGTWTLTSMPVANTAPLGRRYLPTDLSRMRLGDLSDASAAALTSELKK